MRRSDDVPRPRRHGPWRLLPCDDGHKVSEEGSTCNCTRNRRDMHCGLVLVNADWHDLSGSFGGLKRQEYSRGLRHQREWNAFVKWSTVLICQNLEVYEFNLKV